MSVLTTVRLPRMMHPTIDAGCDKKTGRYSLPMPASDVIAEYERTGRRFTAAGVESFVIEAGAGEPVVCMHGVPTSAYLYRKVVPALGRHGVRGIAFDLPGLGLAARPHDFDYTWTGLGRWATAAIDELRLDGSVALLQRGPC